MSKIQYLLNHPNVFEYYLIGEIAYNHEGDYGYATHMIEELGSIERVAAIKFHMLVNLDEYMAPSHPDYPKRKAWLWPETTYYACMDLITSIGKEAIVLVDDVQSVELCKKHGKVAAIELHSVCLNDPLLLEAASSFEGALFLGIGGTDVCDISDAIDFLRSRRSGPIVLMYGIQNYPTDLGAINLGKVRRLADLFGAEVGYCDHTAWNHPDNIWVSTLGYAQGLRILEKHFALEPGATRIDYEAAVGKRQFEELVDRMDLIQKCWGDGSFSLNDAEKKYGALGIMKKTVVARADLRRGQVLGSDCLAFKRTDSPSFIGQAEWARLIGRRLRTDIAQNQPLSYECVDEA